MKQIGSRIKPSSGFGQIIHSISLVLLPALLFILVRIGFIELAIALVLLSKWRIMAVRPRHWLANLRINMVDIFVGVSTVALMAQSSNQLTQLIFAALFAFWLILIKPRSGPVWIGLQALIGQTIALHSLYSVWADKSTFLITLSVAFICILSARHFLTLFDDNMARPIAYVWGYFAACIAWLTAHWLLYYGPIAQPLLLITVVSYGLAALYYLQYHDRLSVMVKRQVVVVISAVAFIIILYSGNVANIIH